MEGAHEVPCGPMIKRIQALKANILLPGTKSAWVRFSLWSQEGPALLRGLLPSDFPAPPPKTHAHTFTPEAEAAPPERQGVVSRGLPPLVIGFITPELVAGLAIAEAVLGIFHKIFVWGEGEKRAPPWR